MSSLALESQLLLLRVARQAIEARLLNRPLALVTASGDLAVSRGVFVTLTRHGQLRGCVGQIEPRDLLPSVVAYCAVAAATEDPRFTPVHAAEIHELDIELSLLTRPSPIRPSEIEIGRHGLIVSRGLARGLLLPQVAEDNYWPVERFLEETCLKAGLDAAAWQDPETRIEAFQADVFDERILRSAAQDGL